MDVGVGDIHLMGAHLLESLLGMSPKPGDREGGLTLCLPLPCCVIFGQVSVPLWASCTMEGQR